MTRPTFLFNVLPYVSLTIAYALLPLAVANADAVDLSKIGSDVTAIKKVIGKDLELAGAYLSGYDGATEKATVLLQSGEEYLRAVQHSYVFDDINNDDRGDLVAVVEHAPEVKDGATRFGSRELRVYLGDKKGAYRLYRKSAKVILTGEDGGMMGDPFVGLTISPKKTISIDHEGGSRQRWGSTHRFQYRSYDRSYDIYLIGTVVTAYDTHTLTSEKVDTNLLTGDQITTKSSEELDVTTVNKKRLGKQPLKKLTAIDTLF